MGKIIGIDLSTTNSAFAYMLAGKARCFMPKVIVLSVVAVGKGERLVGQVAQYGV